MAMVYSGILIDRKKSVLKVMGILSSGAFN
jgi:hypothetical protein